MNFSFKNIPTELKITLLYIATASVLASFILTEDERGNKEMVKSVAQLEQKVIEMTVEMKAMNLLLAGHGRRLDDADK